MFAREGARVAVHYHRNAAAAAATRASLAGEGHALFQADIGRPEEAQRLVREVLASMQRIDILVNNAGMFVLHPPASVSYDDWQKAWERYDRHKSHRYGKRLLLGNPGDDPHREADASSTSPRAVRSAGNRTGPRTAPARPP